MELLKDYDRFYPDKYLAKYYSEVDPEKAELLDFFIEHTSNSPLQHQFVFLGWVAAPPFIS